MLNWTSSTAISSTGRTDSCNIGASDGCRKIRCSGFGTSRCASRDQVKKEVKHRMNRRCQERHWCIQCIMFQRRCQAHRSHAFSTGWTDGASEHSIAAITSAEEGGPTARSVAVCDRFNRRPKHRFNRWSQKLLPKCQRCQRLLQSAEWPEEPMPYASEVPMPTQKLANG